MPTYILYFRKYPNIFGTTYSFMVTDFPDIIIQPSYDIFFVNLCSPPSPSYKQITKGLFGRFSIFSKQRWSKIHSTWMATRGKLASPLMLNNISLQCHVLYSILGTDIFENKIFCSNARGII
uniref:Uncharacterized protein n=1 Tax=Oryza glumipatula TaxID=40148 RepID=A0A0D9ZJJ7_9ORYZ